MAVELTNQPEEIAPDTIEMPAPTAWPIALAFGITLLFAGIGYQRGRQRAGSVHRYCGRRWMVSRCSAA